MSMAAVESGAPVSAEALERHVRTLAGEIGERNVWRPAALDAARDYIRDTWQAQGHAVETQDYEAYGMVCSNLWITLPGTIRPGEIVLMGAHYDTVSGSPGADDNASGVAALLEIGRRLAGTRPQRTLRLVAFVNEEPPFFFVGKMGSAVYARAAKRRGDDIRAMFSLEMLGCYSDAPGSQAYPPGLGRGRPDRGDFIGFVSNLRSRALLKRALAAYRASTDFPVESIATLGWLPGINWSDHLSFWRRGYRALMVTDTAFFRNPHYHSPGDTPEKLDYPRMATMVEGLAGMLLKLGDEDGL